MAFDIGRFTEMTLGSKTFRALTNACIEFFTGEGVEMMSYHHLPPPGANDYNAQITIATHGFPGAWVREYINNRYYKIDPIPRAAVLATRPFWWAEAYRFKGVPAQGRDFLDKLKDAKLGEGLAVPVFGPSGRNGYCGIGFGQVKPRLTESDLSALQWSCQLGHMRYCELLREEAPDGMSLSRRETEILKWVARGKSNSVIAEIVGISVHTVDTHLRRIYMKLQVTDRVTAALRGLAIGAVA
ncbi:MAG: LuxR family transcriptional regulator [Pseudomonadota bacterium]